MRLIDADKIPPLPDMSDCAYEGSEYQAYKSGAEYGRGLVDDAPTIDPESLRPTAHWINEEDGAGDPIIWSCSSCKEPIVLYEGTPMENEYKYCPTCGARMVNADV